MQQERFVPITATEKDVVMLLPKDVSAIVTIQVEIALFKMVYCSFYFEIFLIVFYPLTYLFIKVT